MDHVTRGIKNIALRGTTICEGMFAMLRFASHVTQCWRETQQTKVV